jgi:hypothetical protein
MRIRGDLSKMLYHGEFCILCHTPYIPCYIPAPSKCCIRRIVDKLARVDRLLKVFFQVSRYKSNRNVCHKAVHRIKIFAIRSLEHCETSL